MKESAQTLHTAHRDKNRHWHFLALLLPSMAFVLVLSLFMRNKYAQTSTSNDSVSKVETEAPLTPITVKDTVVRVRLATTPKEQEHGLSGTTHLDSDEGMLFVFASKSQPAFWMKDMLIPLDFIWIADGKVIQLNKNVEAPAAGTPDSQLKLIIPNQLVNYVLEVNTGFIDSHQIVVGDSVTIP